jgi:thymidylate synthase ThyX
VTITAKIVEDTMGPHGRRLTTMDLTYPKFIHGELMTHRMMSRNASSSRAVPPAKMRRLILEDPAGPVAWGKEQKGMQAREDFEGSEKEEAIALWRAAAADAVKNADALQSLGLHKQIVNRVTEPFANIHVVVTASEWDNFFGLRCDPDAQPEMQELAWAMADAYYTSSARRFEGILNPNEMERDVMHWHLPYVGLEERRSYGLQNSLKASTARCARVSYILHSGEQTNIDKDRELHDFLFQQKHMSPFEHQGTPLKKRDEPCRNFRGWYQYRASIKDDVRTFNYLLACAKSGREPAHRKVEWWNR